MSLELIINAILTLLFPVLMGLAIGLAILFERSRAQRLPDHQAPRLEQFARMAVQNVEEQNKDNPNKKTLAISFVEYLFHEWHLPVPSQSAIDIAVGSAFFEVHEK
jgi:hypothetical protein